MAAGTPCRSHSASTRCTAGVSSPLAAENSRQQAKKSAYVSGCRAGNAAATRAICAGEPSTSGVWIGPKLMAQTGAPRSNLRRIVPWMPGPVLRTRPPPWHAATSPRPVRKITSVSCASPAISSAGSSRSRSRFAAVSVASSAAAERPNPALMGSRQTVSTETVTPSLSSAEERGGAAGKVSAGPPAGDSTCIVTEDWPGRSHGCSHPFAYHDTGADAPCCCRIAPVDPPEIPGDVAGTECCHGCRFHGSLELDIYCWSPAFLGVVLTGVCGGDTGQEPPVLFISERISCQIRAAISSFVPVTGLPVFVLLVRMR